MKAQLAVLETFDQPLKLVEMPIPALAPGEVLVQVEAAGVCGSDVHMWRGKDPRTPLPMVLGHEGVGRIVDGPAGLQDIQGHEVSPGQRVLWERGITCGACYYCAVLAQPELCPQRWVYGIHRGLDLHPHLNGCYASHVILAPSTPLISLPEDLDPALFAPASCSGATAAHGFELSPARVGDTVVILGPGPLGAFSAALAKASGARQIVVIGGTAPRMDICCHLGATHTLDRHALSREIRREAVMDMTHGRGADLVVEASGSLSAAREGLDLLRPGGALSLVGFGTPVGQMSLEPFEHLVRKNVRVQGVWVSNVSHTLQAVSLVQGNAAEMDALITHRFALADAIQALRTVADRQAMKAVLLPTAP
jgi:threonine dehydrogenase-like Zn-dependent dehydrogenase